MILGLILAKYTSKPPKAGILIFRHPIPYSKMESGQREISLNALDKIARFFNVTLDELVLYGWTAATRSKG